MVILYYIYFTNSYKNSNDNHRFPKEKSETMAHIVQLIHPRPEDGCSYAHHGGGVAEGNGIVIAHAP